MALVARVHEVSIKEGERYYLKTLLDHKSGATSFKDLRCVNGVQYNTNYDALKQLGLLKEDHWIKTIDDSLMSLPTKLCREIFAHVLVYGELGN